MKGLNVWKIMLFVVVALSVSVGGMYAQKRRGQVNGMPRYDKSTEVTLRGTVEEVESQIGKMGWNGTHLVVRFPGEPRIVHVGPSAYLAKHGFVFAEGDEIEVTGSKVQFQGDEVLVAREIRQGNKLLTLRNQQGIPMWSRSRWRY